MTTHRSCNHHVDIKCNKDFNNKTTVALKQSISNSEVSHVPLVLSMDIKNGSEFQFILKPYGMQANTSQRSHRRINTYNIHKMK